MHVHDGLESEGDLGLLVVDPALEPKVYTYVIASEFNTGSTTVVDKQRGKID
jgi:hypothetical protein